MKKFSSSASLSNNNNCNSNYYCSGGTKNSNSSAKITNKLIANQITNDIIKPKAISAAEAKLKNINNKNYAKSSSSSGAADVTAMTNSAMGKYGGGGEGGVAYKIYNRQEIDSNDYAMRIQQQQHPGTSSIDVLSCISTNSSSDSSSTLNVCDYEAVISATAIAPPASALKARKKPIVNDYASADYVMQQRPKSSQSQHNPYSKSPGEKTKSHHRSKNYSAHGSRSFQQHSQGSGSISQFGSVKKHQHSKKPSAHHHNHKHKQTTAQYATKSHSLHMSSTPPSLPPSPPPSLRLSIAKTDRHS